MMILALFVTTMLVFGVWQVFWIFVWMQARPYWEISAMNSPEGVVIEVYQSDQSEPTYQTLLSGETISQELIRARPDDASIEGVQTLDYDGTIRPGRWKLVVCETELDIMTARMIIDQTTELTPHKRKQN